MAGAVTRMCLGRCGRRVPANAKNGRCASCASTYRPGGHWSEGRDREAQRRFSRAVRARAGGRCEAREDGLRCTATEGLQAHHTDPGNDDPRTGVLLCNRHHRAVDENAR